MEQNRDKKSIDQLVKAHLKLVKDIAKEYEGQGLSSQELIAKGERGLRKAATRFDETRGFQFASYAKWWIRQLILQALADKIRSNGLKR